MQSKLNNNMASFATKDCRIAVVGMACRFPGGANSPDEFWKLLIEKRDARSEIPSDRFDINRFYSNDNTKKEAIITRKAYFVNSKLEEFDASFFGISGKEATAMDPHHRLDPSSFAHFFFIFLV